MKLLENKGLALIIMIVLIIGGFWLGGYKSLAGLYDDVEKVFFTGEDGDGICIENDLSERAEAAVNMVTVARKYVGESNEVRMLSDAAAAFVGLNRLFRLNLTEKELMERAVKIGADVPYCIMRGTALVEGIGEKLTRLDPLPACYVLVGKPGINVSTKMAYENLNLSEIASHPDIDGMIEDIRRKDLYSMAAKMSNVFEPGIVRQYPVIRQIRELMEGNGAVRAMMSGSGPTVFGIFDSKDKMEGAAAVLRESGLARTVFATEIYNRNGGDTNDK